MPMIDIQRRHQTVFRIRFGEKLSNRPSKLTDAIRVTSANPDVVDAFCAVYGGTRKPWENQFEAKLPTTALNILVLPGQSISQWWEKYRGSVCERRCDGKTESKSGKPCMCDPDVEKRTANKNDCAPTTRVSVICPDVAVVGSGMFVCHGLVGAETLPQSIAVAEAALSRGLMVPAVLRVVEFKGLTHFVVPQIEVVGISFNALATATANGQLQHVTRAPELESPAVPFKPVPVAELASPPSLSTREQLLAAPPASKPRANAAAPIRATGLLPRGAAPLAADVLEGGKGGGAESAPVGVAGDAPAPSPSPAIGELVNGEGASMIARRLNKVGIGDDLRPAFLWAFSDGTYKSAHDVPTAQLGALYSKVDAIGRGDLILWTDPAGERGPQLVAPTGSETGSNTEPPPPAVVWRELLGQVKGIAQGRLLRRARDLCVERGLVNGDGQPVVTSIDNIPPDLNADLRAWLETCAAS